MNDAAQNHCSHGSRFSMARMLNNLTVRIQCTYNFCTSIYHVFKKIDKYEIRYIMFFTYRSRFAIFLLGLTTRTGLRRCSVSVLSLSLPSWVCAMFCICLYFFISGIIDKSYVFPKLAGAKSIRERFLARIQLLWWKLLLIVNTLARITSDTICSFSQLALRCNNLNQSLT